MSPCTAQMLDDMRGVEALPVDLVIARARVELQRYREIRRRQLETYRIFMVHAEDVLQEMSEDAIEIEMKELM